MSAKAPLARAWQQASCAPDAPIRVMKNAAESANPKRYPWVAVFPAMVPAFDFDARAWGDPVETEIRCYEPTRKQARASAERLIAELSAEPRKRTRGRPPTNGVLDGSTLARDVYLLEAYERYIREGKSARGARRLAVDELRKRGFKVGRAGEALARLAPADKYTFVRSLVTADGKRVYAPGHLYAERDGQGGIVLKARVGPRPPRPKAAPPAPIVYSKKYHNDT